MEQGQSHQEEASRMAASFDMEKQHLLQVIDEISVTIDQEKIDLRSAFEEERDLMNRLNATSHQHEITRLKIELSDLKGQTREHAGLREEILSLKGGIAGAEREIASAMTQNRQLESMLQESDRHQERLEHALKESEARVFQRESELKESSTRLAVNMKSLEKSKVPLKGLHVRGLKG